MFESEQELVEQFIDCIAQDSSPWAISGIGMEFQYSCGKTDIVLMDKEGCIIAVEAKLHKWKYAIQQAYRCKCFANKSYVLLPTKTARYACQFIEELELRGVGVCSIEDELIFVLHEAREEEPIQSWLNEKAIKYIAG